MSDHLLPSNATQLEIDLALTMDRITDVPVLVREVWDPDLCPAALLPWLAWAFSVDTWDSRWTESQKRETIRTSIRVHKYKGTIGAVKEALIALGFGAEVIEWFNQSPEGDPYTYKLKLEADQIGVDLAGLMKILDVVDYSKNLRSHMDAFEVSAKSDATVYVGSAAGVGSEITLEYEDP